MIRIHVAAGAVAIVAASFFAGWAMGPQSVAAQQEEKGAREEGAVRPGGVGHKLDRPYSVDAHMIAEGKEWKVAIWGAVTWDIESVGDESFLRISNEAQKLWYIPLDRVAWIEATPTGGGAVEPK